ncbi:MAG: ATP-binding protein [Thermodesulfobacteriota bacterium]
MKLAISGKGGVGKTTLTALLAKAFTKRGYRVLAIDADPDANLAAALGFPNPETIRPIAEMADLIEERTGAKPGTVGSVFRLNPKVDDLPEKLSAEVDGVRLMRMGTVKKGGGGCICPESTLLRALVQHLLVERTDVVLMDMEAGIEHLGRGTSEFVDRLIVVLEPGKRSIETAQKIRELAEDIRLLKLGAVGNKIRGPEDEAFLKKNIKGIPLLGFLPYRDSIIRADMDARPPFEGSEDLVELADEMIEKIIQEQGET